MRLVKIVEEVGLRDGLHYGSGMAVPLGPVHSPQTFRVYSIFSKTTIPAGVVCLVEEVGTHQVIVQADMIVPESRD